MEAIEYIERQATLQFEAHLKDMAELNREAHITLSLLILAAGGAFGLAVNKLSSGQHGQLATLLFVMAAWLAILAALTTIKCLRAKDVQHLGNLPNNLVEPAYENLDGLRLDQARKLEGRIAKNRERNEEVAWWLNAIRVALCLTPLGFMAAHYLTRGG